MLGDVLDLIPETTWRFSWYYIAGLHVLQLEYREGADESTLKLTTPVPPRALSSAGPTRDY
jgi:hypothetical protein